MPRKSVVRLTDRPDMTLDVYCGRKTHHNNNKSLLIRVPSLNRVSAYQIHKTTSQNHMFFKFQESSFESIMKIHNEDTELCTDSSTFFPKRGCNNHQVHGFHQCHA